jgi:hypothetical protein
MGYLKPNAQRAKVATIIFTIIIVLDILMIISDFLQIGLLNRIQLGDFTNAEAESNDLRQTILAVIYIAFIITSIVTLILWFRRAYNNLHQLSSRMEYGEGWAAGAWFVPFVNLVRPYKIMKELYVTSNKILIEKVDNYKPLISTSIVGLWWTFYLISNFFSNFASRYAGDQTEIPKIITGSYFSLTSHALQIISGIVTIIVIKRYAILEIQLLDIVPDNATQISDSTDILD